MAAVGHGALGEGEEVEVCQGHQDFGLVRFADDGGDRGEGGSGVDGREDGGDDLGQMRAEALEQFETLDLASADDVGVVRIGLWRRTSSTYRSPSRVQSASMRSPTAVRSRTMAGISLVRMTIRSRSLARSATCGPQAPWSAWLAIQPSITSF